MWNEKVKNLKEEKGIRHRASLVSPKLGHTKAGCVACVNCADFLHSHEEEMTIPQRLIPEILENYFRNEWITLQGICVSPLSLKGGQGMAGKFYLRNKCINFKENNSTLDQRRAYHYSKDKPITNWADFLFPFRCFIELKGIKYLKGFFIK